MKVFRRVLVVAACAGVIAWAAGLPEVRVWWPGNAATALDLFGKSGKSPDTVATGSAPFWTESTRPSSEGTNHDVGHGFADLAEKASPAVVNIQTSKTIKAGPMQVPQPFEEFFGGQLEELFKQREQKVPSLGTGFVISPDGYIVTNNHVVEDVDDIKVAFLDGTERKAEIIGRDPKTDIALIRVKADKPLASLPLGDSDKIRPGDWVVAIGNPYGLGHTVTAGIVSAKGRNIGQGPYDDFIQTDAAINPGNSGGPLINMDGEVVGINTAINPRANTIGFSVAINGAKAILPQLKSTGKVTRGWLGVVIQPITPELAESFKLDDKSGALVSKVDPKGPAAAAGLQRGDVIVQFDGKPVKRMEELPRFVASTPIGREAEVVVKRDGKEKTFEVKVGELKEPEVQASTGKPGEGPSAYGMKVQNLTPEIAEQLGLEDEKGVVVSGVESGSPADEAGIRRGDVILEADKQPVKDVKELQQRLGEAKKGALLLVRRGDATLYVAIKKKE
ncbi:MAG TPA: DegQ family serine endoprotease [Myxococcota bacterium]|nr:DegQ family serine endoprotease [Myxococcota bacterium]